jgi:hypothetical protein
LYTTAKQEKMWGEGGVGGLKKCIKKESVLQKKQIAKIYTT